MMCRAVLACLLCAHFLAPSAPLVFSKVNHLGAQMILSFSSPTQHHGR